MDGMDGIEMLLLSLDCKKIVMSETDGIKGRKDPKFGLWPRNLLKDFPRVASVWPIKNIFSGFACGGGGGGGDVSSWNSLRHYSDIIYLLNLLLGP